MEKRATGFNGDDRCANHGVWQPREHVAVKKLVNGHRNR